MRRLVLPDRVRDLLQSAVPQKVRSRLALLYGLLFLAGGTLLIALTFVLVSNSLQTGGPAAVPTPSQLHGCEVKAEATPRSGKAGGNAKAECAKFFEEGAAQAQADQRNATLSHLRTNSAVGLLGLAVVSAAIGWVVSGRVLRPVRTITETARRASEQHLGERLHLDGPRDELRELADTFDDMLDRLDTAFTSQRQFVANASHELRTPLTSMRTAIDVTLSKPVRTPEQLEAMGERVRRGIDGAEQTIEALLTLAASNQEISDIERVDLATSAEDALDHYAEVLEQSGVKVLSTLQPGVTMGNRVLIERLVSNLLQNAVGYNVPEGWVRVRTGQMNGHSFIDVDNSGPRVPEDLVPHLAEPFRRAGGRTSTHGVGLGLSIVRAVTEAHQGSLDIVSLRDGGLHVTVLFPTVSGPDLHQPD
jgi:signal transduction histidine kinase